ncbi:MAG: hypothetical protein ABIR70_11180 [Bryobacteraceae bacterium]
MPTTFPKERVARAWFDTVLNPLIRVLREESRRLAKNDFTWRVPGRFAALLTIREHLPPEAGENLDQVLKHLPELKAKFDQHDQGLQELEVRVRTYWEKLSTSEDLASLTQRAVLESTEAKGLGAYSFGYEKQFVAYVAEYIVNAMEDLPSYYNLSVPWNLRRKEFLALRDSQPFAALRARAEDASLAFRIIADELADMLVELREQISMELDVPITMA